MKKNSRIKKVVVLATSAMMIMAMTAVSFAAPNPTNSGSIVIEKNLKVTNPDLASVDGPGATFTYEIASETPSTSNGGLTITDANNHTGAVHAGPADGIDFVNDANTISFPIGTAVNASASGADNVKSIGLEGDISKFSAPGIYRYKLTETSTSTSELTATGDGDRYIDVYVTNGASGLEFSGFVMHDGSTENGKPAQKQTFAPAQFDTVNVTLQKTVSGNMADKNHQFPFAAVTSDNGRYHYAKKGAAPTVADATVADGNLSTTLADTEMYYISGLAKNATVDYTETNDTADTYQTSISGGTASAVAAGATKAMGATDVDNAGAVVFNNALEEVSPTGVIMRFGPYIFMVAVAALCISMIRRSKRSEN